MIPLDYLDGSFEFDTELTQLPQGWRASAMGHSADALDQSQAVNDLNQLLNTKMERGELIPQQG